MHQRHQLAAVLHHVAAVRELDLGAVDLFEARDERERHGLGLAASRRGTPAATRCRRPLARRSVSASACAAMVEAAEAPTACDTPFGSTIRITEPSPRMVLPEYMPMWRSLLAIGFTTISSVWNTTSTTRPKVCAPTCVTTMKPRSGMLVLRNELQQAAETDQRQELVAQPQHGGVLDALDAMLGLAVHAHELDHRKLRDGEALAVRLDDQRRDDRERQRNLDGEAQPLALHRMHVDGAADLVDVVADDIDADAAAGHAGDGLRGGEAGIEDELLDLLLGHLVEIGLGRKPVGERLLADARGVEAAAVVGHADDDLPALVIGGQPDRAVLGLAGGDAFGARLDAVIGRVAHHVGERVLDALQHLPVELGVGAVHLELDVLAELGREIAHDARQLLPGIADRLHAGAHHAVLKLGGDVGQPLQRDLEFGIVVAAGDVEQLVAGQHQLGHHRHQLLDGIDADADRLVGDARFGMIVAVEFGSGRPCARRFAGAAGAAARHGRRSRRVAERALELVERNFALVQRPLQRLRHQRSDARSRRGPSVAGLRRRRPQPSSPFRRAPDQVGVVALGLALVLLDRGENVLDAVDGGRE